MNGWLCDRQVTNVLLACKIGHIGFLGASEMQTLFDTVKVTCRPKIHRIIRYRWRRHTSRF